MKKKIMAIGLTVAVLAVAVVGMTLAYFTDTDEETNAFTVGNVKIDLLENFDPDNALLLPGSQTTNKIRKEVWIKNTGNNDAFVWYEWYIPSELDSTDGSTGTNNVVHVNANGNTWDNYREDDRFWPEGQTEPLPLEQTWDHDPEVELELEVGPEGFIRTEEIDGIQYNVYLVLYHGVLAPDEETTVAMNGVYLDEKVDAYVDENGNTVWTISGTNGTRVINYDLNQGVNIIVKAYGIQADLGDNADVYAAWRAYNAQYPSTNN